MLAGIILSFKPPCNISENKIEKMAREKGMVYPDEIKAGDLLNLKEGKSSD